MSFAKIAFSVFYRAVLLLIFAVIALFQPAMVKASEEESDISIEIDEAAETDTEDEIDAGEISVEDEKQFSKSALPGEDAFLIEFPEFGAALFGIGSELELIGGVDASFLGGALDITTVSIRGSAPHRSHVSIGGVPLSSESSGVFDYSMLPASAIGGALVKRGPASVSRGMAGEIELTIRKPQANNFTFSAGSFGTYHAGGAAVLDLLDDSFFIASFDETDGNFSYKRHDGSSYVRNNNSRNKTALLLSLTDEREFGSNNYLLMAANKSGGVPGLAEFPSQSAHQDDSIIAAGFSASRRPDESYDTEIAGFLRVSGTQFDDPEPYLGGSISSEQTEYAAGFSYILRMFDKSGISGVRLSADAIALKDSGFGNPERESLSFTGWRELYFGKAILSAAFSGDLTAGEKPGWKGKIAAERLLGGGWKLAASATKMFRRPNFSELYFPSSGFIGGNSDLTNETGYGFDFGPKFSAGDLEFGVSAFYMRFENSIQFVPVSLYRIRAENTGAIRNSGVSIDASLELESGWSIRGAFTLLDAVYLDGGIAQAGKPPRKLALSVQKDVGDFGMRMTYARTSATPVDRFGNLFVETANELNLWASANLTDNLTLFAACFNVLDHDLRDRLDFPRPGRSIELGLKYSW